MAVGQWASMQPSFIVLFAPVLLLMWHVKMSDKKKGQLSVSHHILLLSFTRFLLSFSHHDFRVHYAEAKPTAQGHIKYVDALWPSLCFKTYFIFIFLIPYNFFPAALSLQPQFHLCVLHSESSIAVFPFQSLRVTHKHGLMLSWNASLTALHACSCKSVQPCWQLWKRFTLQCLRKILISAC